MKLPEPRKLKSGSYFIQLRLNGVSVPVTAASPKDCIKQARLIKAEHLAGAKEIRRDKTNLTLKGAIEAYIAKYEAVLSPSTIRGYDQIKKHRFKDYMDKPARKIDYQEMITEELKTKSAKTVKNAYGLVHAALTHAKIPAPDVKLPQVPVKETPFLQPDEIMPFCDAVKGDIAEIAILLELQGLRRSEVKGLDWSNVDLKRKLIRIRGARVQNKDGEFVRKDTNKNQSSARTVPIMIPQLEASLKAVADKTGPVVTVAENTMLRHTKEACERAGVTVVGNHGLRHSFASLGYHLGLTERQLMDLGGWSDYMTMHKIYIRLAEADKDAANNAVAAFFKGASQQSQKQASKNANENANDGQKDE